MESEADHVGHGNASFQLTQGESNSERNKENVQLQNWEKMEQLKMEQESVNYQIM